MQAIAGATVVAGILSSNVFLVVRTFGLDHLGDALTIGLAQVPASSILGILVGIYLAVRRLG
jgi:hypothetical protein